MNIIPHIKENGRKYILGILFLTACFVWYSMLLEALRTKLTVAFLDIGQGDSIFIEAPNGNQILIDGGSGASVLRKLSNVMPYYDRSIDVVIATHPDKDHVGGLVDVLNRFSVSYFVEPGVLGTTDVFKSLEKSVESHNVKKVIARRGGNIDLGDGVVLNILFPDHDVSRVKDTNDGSIVARLSYRATSAMLTGDAPQSVEARLVALFGKKLESNILKLGHHGSRTSSSAAFLGYVNPAYAIISAGLNNSYGHPHKEVTYLLEKFKIPTLKTYEDGTIIFKSDGDNIEKY